MRAFHSSMQKIQTVSRKLTMAFAILSGAQAGSRLAGIQDEPPGS
jgi:hypothetical protein